MTLDVTGKGGVNDLEVRIGCVEKDIQRLDDLRKTEHDLIHVLIDKNHELMELQVNRLRHEREITTQAQMDAIIKAERSTEKRFEAVNEFRAQLADQATSFLPREVAESELAALRKQVNTIIDRQNYGRGVKSGAGELRDHAVSNANLILATVAIIVTILIATNTI